MVGNKTRKRKRVETVAEERHPDLRLTLMVRNNILWQAIHKDHETVAAFCRSMRESGKTIHQTTVGDLLNFKKSPTKTRTGEYHESCIRISLAVGVPVERLFPEDLYKRITINKQEIEVDSFDALPSGVNQMKLLAGVVEVRSFQISDEDRTNILRIMKAALTEVQFTVVSMGFGFGEYRDKTHTFKQIGNVIGTREKRAHAIFMEAVEKLREGKYASQFDQVFQY